MLVDLNAPGVERFFTAARPPVEIQIVINTRARTVRGPAVTFEQGIRQTVEWFQANEAWWRPIKQGEFRAYYERMYGQRKVLGEVKG